MVERNPTIIQVSHYLLYFYLVYQELNKSNIWSTFPSSPLPYHSFNFIVCLALALFSPTQTPFGAVHICFGAARSIRPVLCVLHTRQLDRQSGN